MLVFDRIKIATFFIAIFLVGCASSDKTPNDLSNIAALKSATAPKISEIRLMSLKQTARGLGAQAGLAWRSRQLSLLLSRQKRNLDHIFNFNYLMLDHNVLPPVLDESRNTLNLADGYTIRASDHYYQIVSPPRFVTAPPNWRDYIWMNYKKPETPVATLLPQNADERQVWNNYIQIGWKEGVNQADSIFSANLGRLERDYSGMILYRKLLAENMLSAPFVSQADLGITGGGNDMRVNDRVLRITSVPQLKANSKNWQPVIANEGENKNRDSLIISNINPKDKI